MRRRSVRIVAGTVLGLALPITGVAVSLGEGPAAAPAIAAATPTSTQSTADHSGAMFAAMMASHHQEGIELAQMALDKSTNEGVRAVAQRSLQNQQAQLPQLRSIAQSGNMSPQPPEQPLQRFNEQEMAELQELSGTEFDRKWLDTFSSHHMSAIMMADMEKESSDSQVRNMAQQIHDQQLQDVTEMNNLRDQLG